MKNIYIAVFIFFASSEALRCQEIPFIEKTILALQKKDNSGDISDSLQKFYNWYKRDMATCEKKEYYSRFTEEITKQSEKYDIKYIVHVLTQKDSAVIKYQTLFERINKKPAKEFPTLTNNCKHKIPPGIYFVWSERNGKPTSDKEKRVELTEELTIELKENF